MSLTFHHVGVACRNLDGETKRFAALGYSAESLDFADPIQGVVGRFLVGGGPRMELLAPLAAGGVLTPWIKAGIKLYHLAYETSDFDGAVAHLRNAGGKMLVPPVPAVAFGNRRITFLMLPNMLMTELIESANS
jgi:methylmalonyl-CoA/ethylmalonyl-CoA epimerase